MYTIAIDMPNLPKGGKLEIDGLGEFVNGETAEVSDVDADSYQARKATLDQKYDDQGFLHGTLVEGPTLDEVFKDHPYITVTYKADPVVAKVVPLVVAPVVAPPIIDSGKVGE